MTKYFTILKSKLEIPNVQKCLFSRRKQTELLNQAYQYKMTLISAPAGYGKTSLISEWARVKSNQVSWISLDESDNDPARFYGYVREALKKLFPDLDGFEENRSPFTSTLVNTLLGRLLNALELVDRPVFVVLEDYHCITDDSVHEILAFLIQYLSQRIHLIISTRYDPPIYLARYRIQNNLKEIRQNDLCFSSDEIGTFLNDKMSLNLTPADIIKIAEKTEGWIAGVQTVALALANCKDKSDFISHFSGSHSFIMNYLVTEVLICQPLDIQHFLLQTSVLDHLSGDLCNAVTKRENSLTILEDLVADNQFIFQLDDQKQWYRYHQLFSEVLRNLLEKETPHQIQEIYERAGDWYEKNNHLNEAIEYAFKTGNITRVIKRIESYASVVLEEGERITIRKWMGQLTEETICARPILSLLDAWSLMNDKTSVSDRLFTQRLQHTEKLLQMPVADINPVLAESSISKENVLNTITVLKAIFAFERGDPSVMFLEGLQKSLRPSESEKNDVYSAILFLMAYSTEKSRS